MSESVSAVAVKRKHPTYAHGWCFTDYGCGTIDRPIHPDAIVAAGVYCCYQMERCPTTDRLHWQGYVYLRVRSSLIAVRKLHDAVHWEFAKGRAVQNLEYCSKDDTCVAPSLRFVHGDIALCGQSKVAALNADTFAAVCKTVVEGRNLKDVARDHPFMVARYASGLSKLASLFPVHRVVATEVLCIVGETGSGKSTRALSHYPDAYWLSHPFRGQEAWWDGYAGEDTVIIDEFTGWLPLNLVLRMIGPPTPMSVNQKHGGAAFVAKLVVFISNMYPDTWYPNIRMEEPKRMEALDRRFLGGGPDDEETRTFTFCRYGPMAPYIAPSRRVVVDVAPAVDEPRHGLANYLFVRD